MELDYSAIGRRIAQRRKQLNLTQSKVAERCDISDQYLSNIERSVSIPSTEIIMRLSIALDTTPDTFLVGSAQYEGSDWRSVSETLRILNTKQLSLVKNFVEWLLTQNI